MTCKDCIHYELCNAESIVAIDENNNEVDTCYLFKDKSKFVELRKGKWIKNEDSIGWHCSCCGKDDFYAYLLNHDAGVYELQDNFCPFCGADMRGDAE